MEGRYSNAYLSNFLRIVKGAILGHPVYELLRQYVVGSYYDEQKAFIEGGVEAVVVKKTILNRAILICLCLRHEFNLIIHHKSTKIIITHRISPRGNQGRH